MQILHLLNNSISITDLCRETGISNTQLIQRLHKLKDMGYLVQRVENFCYLEKEIPHSKIITPIESFDSNFRFLAISDTHFGSDFDCIDYLDKIYDYAICQNISIIFHLGDLIDGVKYATKLWLPSVHEQLEYVISNYPKDNSVKNYILLGNHDAYSISKNGFDIAKQLFEMREDFLFLGYTKAKVSLFDFYIYLMHMYRDVDIVCCEKRKIPQIRLHLAGHFHVASIFVNSNCLHVRVPTLSNGRNKLQIPGAFDITISQYFDEILIHQLIFQPNILVEDEKIFDVKTLKLR